MSTARRILGVRMLAAVLLVLFVSPAFAQNRILKGKVTNEAGAPIQGAVVLIQGTDIKREYTVKTDKKGEYFYMGIPFGEYRIVVRAKGYAPDYAEKIRPTIAEETDTPFKLKPGNSDTKLAFEMTKEEIESIKTEIANQEKQKAASGEVKAAFDAGLALMQQAKYAEAIAEFKKALEKDQKQPYIVANLADALARNNQLPEALETYNKAIELKPDDASIYTNMGVLLGKMGKTAESQEAFKKAAAINPAAAAQNFFNLGATLVNGGRAAEAAEAFKQAIAADAGFAEAYYQLGICLSGNPRTLGEALTALKKYTEIGKNAEQVEVAKQLVAALAPKK